MMGKKGVRVHACWACLAPSAMQLGVGGRVTPSIMPGSTPQDTDPASDWRAAPMDRDIGSTGSGSRSRAAHRRIACHARGRAFRPGASASKPAA